MSARGLCHAMALLALAGCSREPKAQSTNPAVVAPPPPAVRPVTVASPTPPTPSGAPAPVGANAPGAPSSPAAVQTGGFVVEPQKKTFVAIGLGSMRRPQKGPTPSAEESLALLNDALKAHLATGNPLPARIEELVSSGLIQSVPKAPIGKRFEIDAASKEVRLTSAGSAP